MTEETRNLLPDELREESRKYIKKAINSGATDVLVITHKKLGVAEKSTSGQFSLGGEIQDIKQFSASLGSYMLKDKTIRDLVLLAGIFYMEMKEREETTGKVVHTEDIGEQISVTTEDKDI